MKYAIKTKEVFSCNHIGGHSSCIVMGGWGRKAQTNINTKSSNNSAKIMYIYYIRIYRHIECLERSISN